MKKKRERKPDLGLYVAMGLCFGTAFGVITDNLAMGPAIGLLVGVIAYQIRVMWDKKA